MHVNFEHFKWEKRLTPFMFIIRLLRLHIFIEFGVRKVDYFVTFIVKIILGPWTQTINCGGLTVSTVQL